MSRGVKRICGRAALLAATIAAAAVGSAWMVELAPGDAASVYELDVRLSDRAVESLRAERQTDLADWLARLARGELGDSGTFGRPIVELLDERLPVTAALIGKGLSLSWGAALAALVLGVGLSWRWFDMLLTALSGTFLSLPSALLALLCLYAEWPGAIAVAALVFPRLYRSLRDLADRQLTEPHVLAAFARGVPKPIIIGRHVLGRIAPVALTTFGVSVATALGAAVPIEALCDLPGVGQLVWEAALTRDLPVIVALTILVTVVTVTANFLSDLTAELVEPQAS